jgi:hypothetical protein
MASPIPRPAASPPPFEGNKVATAINKNNSPIVIQFTIITILKKFIFDYALID